MVQECSVFGVSRIIFLSSPEKKKKTSKQKKIYCGCWGKQTPMHIPVTLERWVTLWMDNLFHGLSSDVFVNFVFEFYLLCVGGRREFPGSAISDMCCLKSIIVLCLSQEDGDQEDFIVSTCFRGTYILLNWRIVVHRHKWAQCKRLFISYFPCVNFSENKLLLSMAFVNRFPFMCWGKVNCLWFMQNVILCLFLQHWYWYLVEVYQYRVSNR